MPLTPEDRLAIREVVARYNHATDAHDAVARADTFWDDGVFDPTRPALHGREAILNAKRPDGGRNWRHWTDNFIIEGNSNGNTARVTAYLAVFNVGPPVHIQLSGIYRDTLRKIDGEWRFQHRDFLRDDLTKA